MHTMAVLSTLIFVHWAADFKLQNDWMALNKSKAWKPLLAHVGLYSICFIGFGLSFALVTFCLHLATDYWTSRATSKLWFLQSVGNLSANGKEYECYVHQAGNRHDFFVMIGFDQMIHGLSLIWTAYFLGLLI